jgi:hypothetical protein
MHARTHTHTHTHTHMPCKQSNLQPRNTYAHKHYKYRLAFTFITSYIMTVSSVMSLGQKNIMQFISFGRGHPIVFKVKY